MDKLIYNDEYPTIDDHLTDSNVGARQNRNIRDNIFVINAIMNNVTRRNLKDMIYLRMGSRMTNSLYL